VLFANECEANAPLLSKQLLGNFRHSISLRELCHTIPKIAQNIRSLRIFLTVADTQLSGAQKGRSAFSPVRGGGPRNEERGRRLV